MILMTLIGLYILIPLVVTITMCIWVYNKHRKTIEKVRTEPNFESKYSGFDLQRVWYTIFLFLGVIAYGGVSFFLIRLNIPDPSHFHEKVILTGGMVISSASVIASIGQGISMSKAVSEFPWDPKILPEIYDPERPESPEEKEEWENKNEEARKKQTFYKHLTLGVLSHCTIIFGLLITFYLLSLSGIMGYEVGTDSNGSIELEGSNDDTIINASNVERAQDAGVVFSALTVPSILSAILPNYAKGEIWKREVFKKKLILGCIGLVPVIVGTIIATVMLFT